MVPEERPENHRSVSTRTPAHLLLSGLLSLGLATMGLHAQDDQPPAPDEPASPAPSESSEAEAATPPADVSNIDTVRSDARKAMSESKWNQAVADWNRVLALAPDDAEAKAGLARAQAALDQASTISSVESDIAVRREQAIVEFNSELARAQSQIEEGAYDTAQRTTLTAKVRLERNRTILPVPAYNDMVRRAEQLLVQISDVKINAQLIQQDIERQQASSAASEQQRIEAADRQRQIRESIIRVRQLQMELKYDEALQILEQILFMDPLNPAAQALQDVITTSKIYMNVADYNRQKSLAYGQLFAENQAAMIPPRVNLTGPGPKSTNALVSYPEDWPQLSKKRMGASGYIESPANMRVQSALQTPVSVNFSRNSIQQVVNYMKTVTEVEIYADWRALEGIGIRPEDEVTLELGRVSAEVALRRVLEQLGDRLDRPQFGIEDGMVVITTEDTLRKRMVTLVYDIRDLLLEVPYFDNAPDFDLGDKVTGGPASNGGSVAGLALEADRERAEVFGRDSNASGKARRQSRDQLVDEIVQIIQDVVDPEQGWYDTSGQGGKIQELNGNLIITNTPRNHRAIEGLLDQLRTIRSLQINVEARLLNVQMDWFEEIGLDLDLYFNTNDQMFQQARASDPTFQLSDFFTAGGGRPATPFYWVTEANYDPTNPNERPILPTLGGPAAAPVAEYPGGPFAPVGREDGWDPIGVSQNSLGFIQSLIGAAGNTFAQTALANPALSVGLSYLDDIQVDLLIQATQADKRNSVLTAPRITLFNGQRSWISVAEGITYVSGLVPGTGDSSGAFAPITDVVYAGFVLDVEAVISSDRRYVTMTVSFNLNQNVSFTPSTFEGAAGGGGGIGGGGRASTFSATIQLPQLQGTQIRTTVSVPDKGTIMLGGQRNVSEVDIEAGVPVLSKIPFVNRFFTNRLTSKEEKTTLLLIRPEIIIQRENEDDLFPGLSEELGTGSGYLGF